MRKNKFIIFSTILLLLFGFFLTKNFVQAGDEGDAIAVRIVSNPDHYSINEWYEKQGFTGSPQALIVDGYNAIRDGRTVYIGAANLKGNLIYTNVYLISYNQDSSNRTIDILGQIIKKWKFNTDLERASANFTCSISSTACSINSDCSDGQVCGTSGIASSSCQLAAAKNCVLDSDCPDNFFCDSTKAKIIRDLDRIGTVRDLNTSLSDYRKLNGFYPKLEAGTYLANYTVSVWPSWTDTFLSGLNLSSFKDPINRLGACPGYDPITCWNKDTKKFVNNPQADGLVLPAGSYGLAYKTDANGTNYKLCSVFETKGIGYSFEPSSSDSSSCVQNIGAISSGQFANTAPVIVDLYLTGEPGQAFNGSVKVVDAEDNPLTWTLNTSGTSWSGWSAAPVLKDTNNSNVKKIYAAKAGNPGRYQINLLVSDGQGGSVATSAPIIISVAKPLIEAENFELLTDNASSTYSFYVSGGSIDSAHTFFSIVKTSGQNNVSLTNPVVTAAGENRYKITYTINIPSGSTFDEDSGDNYIFKITAWNTYSAQSTKNVQALIGSSKSGVSFNCPSSQRVNTPYSCILGPTSQNGVALTYSSLSTLPTGLLIKNVSSQAYLSGTPTTLFDNIVAIKVTATASSKSASSTFPLRINNYCGDGTKQSPNTEGAGGPQNNGQEDCDGTSGITDSVPNSNINNQYGCSTGQGATVPFPITNNSYCVYKAPNNGGGYCGDGYCQVKIGNKDMENACNCPSDCASTMSCCGNGIVDEGEACDTALPAKPCSSNFSAGLPSYCSEIPVSGKQTCKPDCSGYGDCKLDDPVMISNNITDCNPSSTVMIGYSCCELEYCVHDKCGCCGRFENDFDGVTNPGWVDLLKQATDNNYAVRDYASPYRNTYLKNTDRRYPYFGIYNPYEGACTKQIQDADGRLSVEICTCGTSGCFPQDLCPGGYESLAGYQNNSCVLAQSKDNLTKWWGLINHTTAYYKCWK